MDRKTLSGKTVKDLRAMCNEKLLIIKPNTIKDEIIDQLVRCEQKQKRLLKKAEKASAPKASAPKETNDAAPAPPSAPAAPAAASPSVAPSPSAAQSPAGVPSTPPPSEPKSRTSAPKVIKKVPSSQDVKKSPDGKYTIIQQLGSSGKEGTTYLVKNKKGDEFAMKMFSKHKSVNMLLKEVVFQKQAAKHDIAPQIKETNEEHKYIVMEKLDKNLFDIVKKNQGAIPDTVQRKIVSVIKKMDGTGVFHGDPNPANFMLKGNSMYMIDYGFAKDIDDKLMKKYETEVPNSKFMILGLILKLKEIYKDHNPNIEYKILSKAL